ncbi:ATP-binding region, ATPase domain protein domain protein (plasmid) [Nocardioides sp. JS614]|nr:ATP-binding region, ATPase domain protein domain protein [Nocardioides sp. JS614]
MVPLSGVGLRVLVVCLAWVALATAATIALELRNGSATANLKTPSDVLFLLFALAPAVAGALTLTLSRNRRVGWLLVAATTLGITAFLLHAVVVALERTGDAPGLLVWPALWVGGPAFALLALVPGRVRSPSRRPLLEPVAVSAIGALALAQAFGADPLTGVGDLDPIENPLGVPALFDAANLAIDVVPLVILGYAALGLALLAWDRIVRRQPTDPDRRPWAVLGLLLPLTIAIGIAVGGATGQGPFVGAWVAAVVTPIAVLVVATVLVVRAWAAERRTTEALRRDAEAREVERHRVRRDLHDGIGPALAGMRLHIEVLRDGLPEDAAIARSAADRLEESVDETLNELRRIVDGMQPSSLDTLGFRGALEALRASLTSTWPDGRTTVEVEVDRTLPSLPRPVEAALFRVSAEALSNAVRHAAPRHCSVSVTWRDGAACLAVVDDGTGIPVGAGQRGLGLRSMRDRIVEVGGTLEVGPADDGPGTAVIAVVPVVGIAT